MTLLQPLDPLHLTPTASLNRLRIVDLPGVVLDPDVGGKTGYELLSVAALAAAIRRDAAALGLRDDEEDDGAVLRAFDRCLVADDPAVRGAAQALAARFGRRLGYLLATLRRGDAINRRARPDWDDTYWRHWAGICRVWIGGGLVSGHLGPHLLRQAAAVGDGETPAYVLRLAAEPALLPLIGAARSVPVGCQTAVVCDFGQSEIKRALAVYEGTMLVALRLLPRLPARFATPNRDGAITTGQVRQLADELVAILADTWRAAHARGPRPAPVLVTSLAAYVRDGQPLPRQGGAYATLHRLSANLGQWLSCRVSERAGHPLEVVLLHDGSAAAQVYAGEALAAVLLLGTALGVGFPPPRGSLRPITRHLLVTPATSSGQTQAARP
jgi:hypothetical protein